MPNYKHSQFFHVNQSELFDKVLAPATQTPASGIYRCEGCGEEVSSTSPHPIPPQNHHQHMIPGQGAVRWRLVAACCHNG